LTFTHGVSGPQQSSAVVDTSASTSAGKAAAIAAAARSSQPASSGGVPTTGDQAILSTASGLLAQALSGNDARLEKVAGLQQQIAAGTYSVPAADVAASIFNSLLG
jgi:negative regulator of flagellin synthesis FlgM